eukprot:15349703-Ditylum_brightwellii.AAC.1
MREAGHKIDDMPKFHTKDPSIENHSILIEDKDLRIPLKLHVACSYFPTSKPTNQQLEECNNDDCIATISPYGPWHPHCNSFASNEASMIDWQGDFVRRKEKTNVILSEVYASETMTLSCMIGSVEDRAIDSTLSTNGVGYYDDE